MLPDFVIGLFENEIRRVLKEVIDVGVDKFKLSREAYEAAIEQKIGMGLQLVTENEEIVKITRNKPRAIPPDNERCKARILKHGLYCQCMFRKVSKSMFCARHTNTPSKHGIITQAEPRPPPASNPLKKHNKIY